MKFTRDWLFSHLETDRPLAEILDVLPMLGLEVESVVDRAIALAPFVIAEVISAEQHPNADKLRVCMVDIGAGDPDSGGMWRAKCTRWHERCFCAGWCLCSGDRSDAENW
jgi:hypothetical protein